MTSSSIETDNNSQDIQTPRQSRIGEFWDQFRKNRLALLGLIIFVLFFFIAVTGLFLTKGPDPVLKPNQIRLPDKLLPPLSFPDTGELRQDQIPPLGIYLFGTDNLGRDVFARMLEGAWISLTVGFVAVGISVLIGIIMGGVAGYFGNRILTFERILQGLLFLLGCGLVYYQILIPGYICLFVTLIYLLQSKYQSRFSGSVLNPLNKLSSAGVSVDTIIMRFVDIMLCFPSFFLILTVIALLPPSIYNIMVVIGITSWMAPARLVRAEFLSLREQDFVSAANALGVSNNRIIFQHMLPNAIAPVLVSATIGIAMAILTEAGLSFLGFGVPPPQATWGNILSEGKRFLFDAPWLTLIPGIAILIVVLSFNLFGEGLRDTLNPKLDN